MRVEVNYGAYVVGSDGERVFRVTIPEATMRDVLQREFPGEVVDRVLSRLRAETERQLRRV